MQEYKDVLKSNTVQEMRTIVNDNLNTLRSTYAGEAFPTENLVLGMKCFRTDKKKTYTLVSMNPDKWAVEASGREDIVSAQMFLALVGTEALNRLTDWTGLLHNAISVEVFDFDELGTGSKVTNMSFLFRGCISLKSVLNFIIRKDHPVKDVQGMFSGCDRLAALDVSGFQAENVENYTEMFYGCRSLKTLNVSDWKMGKAKSMKGMFLRCEGLESLDVSKWDVSSCTDFAEMFRECHKLRGVQFTSWDTSKATAMGGMFQSCGATTVWAEGGHRDAGGFVAYVIPLNLDLSMFDLSNVETTAKMFAYAKARLTIGEKMRKTVKCRNMSGMFLHFFTDVEPVIAGEEYKPPVIDTDYTSPNYGSPIKYADCKKSIFTVFDYSSVENMYGMFEGTYAVNCTLNKDYTRDKKEPANGLIFHVSTPKVTNVSRLFASAHGAQFMDISMNIEKITDMLGMFDGANPESIRLRNFDTQKMTVGWGGAIPIDGMFKDCRNMRYLIIDDTTFKFKLLKDVLADLPAECRFVVPRAMIATYKAQEHWKNYGDRFIAMEDCTLIGAYVYSAPE